MECRSGCGACCIAPSITTAMPGMPTGKPAGVPCLHLLVDLRCALFGSSTRPDFCGSLQPALDMCGTDREHAIRWISALETQTAP